MARILVLEDDEILRETLIDVLVNFGHHQVDGAEDAASAIELAHRHVYDLMMSDIRMAGMDGLAAVARIKREQKHLPIIMITGKEEEGDRGRAVDIAVDAYLHKGELVDLYGGVQGTLKIVDSLLAQPQQKGFFKTLLEPLWAKPLELWQAHQDKREHARQQEYRRAKVQLEEAKDMAYRRLVTAIMSNMILQGPSLDIYDMLTDIDIAYARSKSPEELADLTVKYSRIRELILQHEKSPGISSKPRPENRLSRPAWKKITEKVKQAKINPTQLQYLEKLRWMPAEKRRAKANYEELYQQAFGA